MTEPSSKAMNRLTEAMAANREVTDRQLRALAATVERTSQNVDPTVEGMQQSATRIEHQVGLMSEHLTAIDIKIESVTSLRPKGTELPYLAIWLS